MKLLILLAVTLISLSALAIDVSCEVRINGQLITNEIKTIPQEKGEGEGAGHLLIASTGDIKIFITNYPLQIVANYLEQGDVVIDVKKSNILATLALHRNSATLKTTMLDNKIYAKCIEVSID